MNDSNRETLRKMAEALDLSPADLRAVADASAAHSAAPTIAEFLEDAIAVCSSKSLPTYQPHYNDIVAAHGDRRLSDVTANDLAKLRDARMLRAATIKVERAQRNGRPLRSYELDAHGQGAGENAVRAYRSFFRAALLAGHIQSNVAMNVKVPKRLPAPERPLDVAELDEIALIWCTSGNDPDLDALLFEFHRKTASRREGALNLRLSGLDERRGAVVLTEKFGKIRELPLDVGFLRRLRQFAHSRGATSPSCHVFRGLAGRHITRKRYETIYRRIDRSTDWTEVLDVGVHWIRHTTLDDVRSVADARVAAAYAGHDDSSMGTIGLYTKVTFDELVGAYEAIFGARFPEAQSSRG